jgi:hypothetical protein
MYNNFSSKKTKKVISALLASALVVTSAPITADAATTKIVGVNKTITLVKGTVTGLSKAEKKVVKVSKNSKTKKVTVKGLKAGKVSFKIGKKAYTVKVGATKVKASAAATSLKVNATTKLSITAVNGAKDKLKISTSDKSVVKISKSSVTADAKGKAKITLRGLAAGTSTITVKSANTGKKATVAITVLGDDVTPAPATEAPVGPTEAPVGPTVAPTSGSAVTATPTANSGNKATQGTIAVTTTATNAAIVVTSGSSVVAQATTTPDKTSATFANLANGTYVVEITQAGYGVFKQEVVVDGNTVTVNAKLEAAKAVSAKAVSETKVQVKFNTPLDAATVANFKVSNVSVTKVSLSDDKMTATLETGTMTTGQKYTVSTTGLTSAGVALADATFEFEAKTIKYEMKLSFANNKTTLASNGKDAVLVTAEIVDEDGDIVSDLDKVEIEFTTTAGNFAQNRVTVQNGKATNMLTSETSTTDISALVTATVVSSSNKNILNVTTRKTILMTPNVAAAVDETVGATLVDVAVETADRIVLYFNKDVDVTKYTKQDTVGGDVYGCDSAKMLIKVQDSAKNDDTTIVGAGNRTVKALAPVPGNSKALVAILDVSGATTNDKPLTDNSKVLVYVKDNTGSVQPDATKSTLVSDIRVPSILAVENDGLTTLKVTFSEPVQTTAGAGGDQTYAADAESHWIIDGTELTNAKYGVGAAATATVGVFDVVTGEDTRNVVTITLGKDDKGKQIYFKSGAHSIQGNKIGDWANLTDKENNIINTQTLDFTIDPDNTVPTAEVKVESPEQYTVTFNKYVNITDVKNNLKLQVYNATSGKWENDTNPINVTAEGVKSGLAKEFVVEVTKDWTVALSTSTKHVNYYNNDYRLFIENKKLENPSNGLTNADIVMLLNDPIMKSIDATSPEIVSVDQIGTKNQFKVTLTEPVQVSNLASEATDTTPSETQGTAVQKTTVTFISADGKTTVPGTIAQMSDAHDTAFIVNPSETLTAGTWKIVITGLSDDYGNTIATRSDKTFEVKGVTEVVDTTFKVQWIYAVPFGAAGFDEIGKSGYNTSADDIVYVKFNKKFKTSGGAANAINTANYQVNGYKLAATTKIDASVKGYNDTANIKNNYTDLVAIHLPKGTLSTSNTVQISSTIESALGGTLSNYGMKVLDPTAAGIFTYNYKSIDGTYSGVLNTADKVKKAFANSEYTNVKVSGATVDKSGATCASDSAALTDGATEETKVNATELKISSVGTYDLSNVTAEWKSLTIDTEETGIITVKGGKYGAITVNAPNAEVVLDSITCTTNVEVKDVMSGTLTIKDCTITGSVTITDNNGGAAVKTEETTLGSLIIGEMIIVKTTGAVTLDTNKDVKIEKPAEVTFVGNAPSVVKVNPTNAKGVKITTVGNVSTTVEDLNGNAITDSNIAKVEEAKFDATVELEIVTDAGDISAPCTDKPVNLDAAAEKIQANAGCVTLTKDASSGVYKVNLKAGKTKADLQEVALYNTTKKWIPIKVTVSGKETLSSLVGAKWSNEDTHTEPTTLVADDLMPSDEKSFVWFVYAGQSGTTAAVGGVTTKTLTIPGYNPITIKLDLSAIQ